MSADQKTKIGLLWHMHQPYYFNPDTNKLDMPWVRFHGVKDYLDMALLASRYENVRCTFNLVPSLLDQIGLYNSGITDYHFDLSLVSARELAPEQKKTILETFFSANHQTMVEPYVRYRQLYRKKDGCGTDLDLAVKIFSASEWRDLQVWSNLVWVDRMFRTEEPVRRLFEKGRDFTEEDKGELLAFHLDVLRRIIPTYKRLYEEDRIDISFTPYYHPILPLLVDHESAREAISDIDLPEHAFKFPEDAAVQIEKSCRQFSDIFGGNLEGMWPSEGSVSEPVLELIKSAGISWTASDEEILSGSLHKSGITPDYNCSYRSYEYSKASGLKIFFRDRILSDKIGFVYASWHPERAIGDFLHSLRQIDRECSVPKEDRVIPIILDGENAWEYYPDDGVGFLTAMYETLNKSNEFRISGYSELARETKAMNLPSVLAGSWIRHNFQIWIGHPEDNMAWDLLFVARQKVVEFEKQNPQAKEAAKEAWEQIYIAEGSDWCWWYGDDHIGVHNPRFDALFRRHLSRAYIILGQDVPEELSRPIFKGHLRSFLSAPESLITPVLDGQITHYYEWSGSGHFQCGLACLAMHRTEHYISNIYFAFDYDRFYIRLDFEKRFHLVVAENSRLVVDFGSSGQYGFDFKNGFKDDSLGVESVFERVFEAGFDRKILTSTGYGEISMTIALYNKDKLIEKWPADNPIRIDLPERDKEIFWQV